MFWNKFVTGTCSRHAEILESVEYLSSKNPDLNLQLRDFKTVAHVAVNHANLPVLRLICDQKEGAQLLEVQDNIGKTPGHLAANSANVEVLEFICDRKDGAQLIGIQDRLGWTVAHAAVSHPDAVSVTNHETMGFPLMPPTFRGNNLQDSIIECLVVLLNTNADLVNITDTNGRTLAHYAAYHGQLHVLQFLYQRDANIFSARDSRGQRPFDLTRDPNIRQWLTDERLALERLNNFINKSVKQIISNLIN